MQSVDAAITATRAAPISQDKRNMRPPCGMALPISSSTTRRQVRDQPRLAETDIGFGEARCIDFKVLTCPCIRKGRVAPYRINRKTLLDFPKARRVDSK
ncbi:hypothetical protein [Mesorhizobium sp. L-8-10]|uniref:hypothetical protein n=1 Tax=Mesorhizobium sp. L-8-10 TaxID=2744523 RepID=UPI001927D669|nr:hypothetical protein [Mesorhizobium sp. L-8-10]